MPFLPFSTKPLESTKKEAGFFKDDDCFALIVGATTSLFAILVFGLYMAVSPDLYLRGILQFVPRQNRLRARKIINGIGDVIQWWLIGQLLDMISVGLMVTIGLWLLGVPLAMTLGLLAGLLDFVPVVDAIVSAVPAILIALTVSPYKALSVAILFCWKDTCRAR